MEVQMLCRVCFEMGHFGLDGYEVNVEGNNISIEKMIQRFSDIELIDSNAPEMICESCTQDLVQSYIFTEKIQQADARILSMFESQPQDTPIVYEEEVQIQKDAEVEELSQTSLENERLTDEEEDITEENSESRIVEEIFLDTECPEENEDLICAPEICTVSNYETKEEKKEEDEESIEPKRKVYCRKRSKQSKEVLGGGSFVITQFISSAASKTQMNNIISEDTDEVTLSDIRTMNFEAVEVNAGNMSVITEDDQGELPIDDTRVYLCQYCPKAFSSSPFLISHVRKSHGCKYCAKMFEKSADLYQHIRQEHSTFKCVVCEKDFASNSNLRYHLKTVHKLKVPANVALLSYKKSGKTIDTEVEIDSS